MSLPANITIGVSACLLGEKVRFNGEAKRRNTFLEGLRDTFTLETVCPEVGIGLGVPRETIRLVAVGGAVDGENRARHSRPDSTRQGDPNGTHNGTHKGGSDVAPNGDRGDGHNSDRNLTPNNNNPNDPGPGRDVTDALRRFARDTLRAHPRWSGYIGVKGSPSCGYRQVKRYTPAGNPLPSDGVGLFIDEMQSANPLLPIEEDGRLHDAGLRHSFILRVITYARWQALRADGLSAAGILSFYSRHKYLLMAHSVPEYKALGRRLADAGKLEPRALGAEVAGRLLEAFRTPATRGGNSNVLYHLSGYLKRRIGPREREEIRGLVEQYRNNEVPLVVPVTLLNSYFSRHPDPYIAEQLFMLPFPTKLGLRNAL